MNGQRRTVVQKATELEGGSPRKRLDRRGRDGQCTATSPGEDADPHAENPTAGVPRRIETMGVLLQHLLLGLAQVGLKCLFFFLISIVFLFSGFFILLFVLFLYLC
jgi:hypothetical protein